MNRLWALLVALCAVGILLASPFLLGAIRAVQSPMAPPVLLTLQALQTLLLCALAAYAGVCFAPPPGSTLPGCGRSQKAAACHPPSEAWPSRLPRSAASPPSS